MLLSLTQFQRQSSSETADTVVLSPSYLRPMKEDDGVPVKRNYIAKGGWLTYGQRDSLTKLQTSGCNCVPLMMVIKKRDGISASFCSSLSSCGSLLHVVFMFILLFPQVKKNSSKGIHSFSAARGVDGTRLA